jgi:hypothetical protein
LARDRANGGHDEERAVHAQLKSGTSGFGVAPASGIRVLFDGFVFVGADFGLNAERKVKEHVAADDGGRVGGSG